MVSATILRSHLIPAATRAGLGDARFIKCDAQCFDFPRHAFDAVTSRFGVMFFDDPARAFANVRHAVRPNGTLARVAWRTEVENPFMIAAERAAPILCWTDQVAPMRSVNPLLPTRLASNASSAQPGGLGSNSARLTFRVACTRPISPYIRHAWGVSA